MQKFPLNFDEETIVKIFGTEAAEDDDFDRLRSYYVKNRTHEKLTADVPIRILVGHKGIGKSAVFKMAQNEDESKHRLTVLIHPDDITDIGEDITDFHKAIRSWKSGLIEVIAGKITEQLGEFSSNPNIQEVGKVGGKIISRIVQTFKKQIDDNIEIEPAYKLLIEKFLKEKKIKVYIDDLDRGWEGKPSDIKRISALLNAVRDLTNENKGLGFRISLRSDVYYLVRTSDESTDKIETNVIWHSWTNHEIMLLLIKRIESFFDREFNVDANKNVPQSKLSVFLSPIFEPKFSGKGKWENVPTYKVLMSLIRKRPRDLIKICTLAARHAADNSRNRIATEDIQAVLSEYSNGRIQDTVNEYKTELPKIQTLILNMKPSQKEVKNGQGYIYTTHTLSRKISNILEQGDLHYAGGRKATPKDLSTFLYKINFITARKQVAGRIQRYYFEEKQYVSGAGADFGFDWEIHPAFRWALSPDNFEKPMHEVELFEDDL